MNVICEDVIAAFASQKGRKLPVKLLIPPATAGVKVMPAGPLAAYTNAFKPEEEPLAPSEVNEASSV